MGQITWRGTNRVPTRNDNGFCTAAHSTRASTVVGTPWRGWDGDANRCFPVDGAIGTARNAPKLN